MGRGSHRSQYHGTNDLAASRNGRASLKRAPVSDKLIARRHHEVATKKVTAMHQGFTVWFTGLSGSGKSTLTDLLEAEFKRRGYKIEVLDGDVVRTNLSKGLNFSKADRDINIRRIGFVCDLLSRNGVIAISAAISPYESVRREVRALIESDSAAFVEIYTKCSLDALVDRDVKGLYKKALSGEIQNFTGVSDPYEEPANPEITIESDKQSVEESLQQILRYLEEKELIGKDG
jgi:adenylyl-sulfate kinase